MNHPRLVVTLSLIAALLVGGVLGWLAYQDGFFLGTNRFDWGYGITFRYPVLPSATWEETEEGLFYTTGIPATRTGLYTGPEGIRPKRLLLGDAIGTTTDSITPESFINQHYPVVYEGYSGLYRTSETPIHTDNFSGYIVTYDSDGMVPLSGEVLVVEPMVACESGTSSVCGAGIIYTVDNQEYLYTTAQFAALAKSIGLDQ